MINRELIDIMVCPACKAGIEEENGKIICRSCGGEYPVINGIPVMLVDEKKEERDV